MEISLKWEGDLKLRYRLKLSYVKSCNVSLCGPVDFIEYVTPRAEWYSVHLKYLKSLYVCLTDVCVLSPSFHHL